MKACDYCFERINGGAYITKERKYHFCSESCVIKWERESKKKDEEAKEMSSL